MNEFWKVQISKIVDFFTRQRKPSYILLATGVSLLGFKQAISYVISVTFSWGTINVGSDTGNFITDYLVPIIGVLLCVTGCAIVVFDEIKMSRNNSRKRIILIEGEGLRKTIGTGLDTLVRSTLKGTIVDLPIDITQRIRDGYVIEPEKTFLNKVLPAKELLGQLLDRRDSGDTQIVYGGFLPVPFTFYLGNIIDDKANVAVYDWDREFECWKAISEKVTDDGESFVHESVRGGDFSEVVLVVSCSYLVDLEAVMDSFNEFPIEHLRLENTSFSNHWSLTKQRRLALQFSEKVKLLSGKGVKKIHLILAAQSSLVLNIGRRYDSRNMPNIIVYQYEKTNKDPYPWGVLGLTHGYENSGFIEKSEKIVP